MNAEQIAKLKELAQAATPGPWATDDPWIVYAKIGNEVVYLANTSQLDTTRTQYPKDAAFIAGANPAAVLELIGDLEIARAAIEAHQKAAKHRQNRIAELETLLAERTTSPVSQMTDEQAWEVIKAEQGTQVTDWRGRTAIVIESPSEAGDVVRAILAAAATHAQAPAAPVAEPAEKPWHQVATVTMDGHQLREALNFLNPDGDAEPDQLDEELTFGVVQHKDDDGTVSTGLCCWNDDTDGVYPLTGDGAYAPKAAEPATQPQPVAEQGELPPLPVDLDYLIEYIAQPAVREALRNQISAYARAAIAASQPPQDERAAFEVWAASRLASIHRHKAAGHDLNGSYISVSTQAAWEAWQARAAMAKGGAANCQDNEGEK